MATGKPSIQTDITEPAAAPAVEQANPGGGIRDLVWFLSEDQIRQRLSAFLKERFSQPIDLALQDDILDMARLAEAIGKLPERSQ